MLNALIQKHGLTSVAIVGMAKNVGKTVTLNQLAKEAAAAGTTLGLTSIGRDGEKTDAVFRFPKPGIHAPEGCFLATAQKSLQYSEARVEVISGTGFNTAMGEVMIGRVTAAGFVELAGATLFSQQKEIISRLRTLGAELTIIDGALDRVSSAAPSIAEGTVLCTGAALAAGMHDVLTKTGNTIARLSMPGIDSSFQLYCRELMADGKASLIQSDGRLLQLPVAGTLVAGDAVAGAMNRETEAVVVPGAVGNLLLRKITAKMAYTGGVRMVIRDGTRLFADWGVWRDFNNAGGTINVLEEINLLAVTVNPFSPVGPCFEADDFLAAAGRAFKPHPVLDVVLGKAYLPDGTFREAQITEI